MLSLWCNTASPLAARQLIGLRLTKHHTGQDESTGRLVELNQQHFDVLALVTLENAAINSHRFRLDADERHPLSTTRTNLLLGGHWLWSRVLGLDTK